MTYEEMLQMQKQMETTPRAKHGDPEHRLQCSCVRWFRLQFPHLAYALFAVPNGGSRNKAEAARMKNEGVTAGVSDLILLKSNRHHSALCIEMKTKEGKQNQAQKAWQAFIERWDARYVICRSLDDFMDEIRNYLGDV